MENRREFKLTYLQNIKKDTQRKCSHSVTKF